MKKMISIIIPTLNEEIYLPKLLKSIKEQDYENYEVIIADAGSTDSTKDIAREFDCKIVRGGLPAVGRNAGGEVARGKYLLFLDADVVLHNDFIKKALKEFEERSLDIATCRFYPLSDRYIDILLHQVYFIYMLVLQYSSPKAPGFCILSRRWVFNMTRGFDEKIRVGEDHDYCIRASKFGAFRILKKPKLYVSVRRLEKEGRLGLATKYVTYSVYKNLTGKDFPLMKYEFSNYNNISHEKERSFYNKIVNKISAKKEM
ncbi:MAG TPA: glycosyltransferase [Patescibacteria group bacterium]|nr:glycosyltransferase [Patescibacteria group bacterium]